MVILHGEKLYYSEIKHACWQVFCYALSANDGSEWRVRIQSEVEHFIEVSSMSSDMIARMINEDKIQILVNLNSYTKVNNSEKDFEKVIGFLKGTLSKDPYHSLLQL
uniref:O-GlcNAc transferase C-terminal domain-containing protein n=1 Tax=Cannabis sativa TaxID=3483 RepID=A0A803Q2H1_CANSA